MNTKYHTDIQDYTLPIPQKLLSAITQFLQKKYQAALALNRKRIEQAELIAGHLRDNTLDTYVPQKTDPLFIDHYQEETT